MTYMSVIRVALIESFLVILSASSPNEEDARQINAASPRPPGKRKSFLVRAAAAYGRMTASVRTEARPRDAPHENTFRLLKISIEITRHVTKTAKADPGIFFVARSHPAPKLVGT
jgi:uncharacterized membrane protein YccC